MAKESGITTQIQVDSSVPALQDISNDILSADISTPKNTQDVTGLDKSAVERLQLLADYSATLNGNFNDAADKSHAVLSTVPSTSVARTVTTTISGQVLTAETFINDYALSRSATGELTWTAPCVLQDGSLPTWA